MEIESLCQVKTIFKNNLYIIQKASQFKTNNLIKDYKKYSHLIVYIQNTCMIDNRDGLLRTCDFCLVDCWDIYSIINIRFRTTENSGVLSNYMINLYFKFLQRTCFMHRRMHCILIP